MLAAATPEERASLAAYVEGVNAGREALSARQFPYLLLRQQPQPATKDELIKNTRAVLRARCKPAGWPALSSAWMATPQES